LVKTHDVICPAFIRVRATALTHAAIYVVLTDEGFMELGQLLLFANKNNLFEYLDALFSFGLLFIFDLLLLWFFFFLSISSFLILSSWVGFCCLRGLADDFPTVRV
jgi:hypothetical protein